jgi:hypothetical protein
MPNGNVVGINTISGGMEKISDGRLNTIGIGEIGVE